MSTLAEDNTNETVDHSGRPTYDDVNVPFVVVLGVVSAIVTYVCIIGVQGLYYHWEDAQIRKKEYGATIAAAQTIEEQKELLQDFHQAKDGESKAIPIDLAMTLTLKDLANADHDGHGESPTGEEESHDDTSDEKAAAKKADDKGAGDEGAGDEGAKTVDAKDKPKKSEPVAENKEAPAKDETAKVEAKTDESAEEQPEESTDVNKTSEADKKNSKQESDGTTAENKAPEAKAEDAN